MCMRTSRSILLCNWALKWKLEPGVVGKLGDCEANWCEFSVGKRSGFKLDENMTVEAFDRKVLEVVSARGRKGTDSKELMQQLQAREPTRACAHCALVRASISCINW